jgi:ABC-type transport system involved in cytochrome bd biosynthesis fused ATPase/permease subunit
MTMNETTNSLADAVRALNTIEPMARRMDALTALVRAADRFRATTDEAVSELLIALEEPTAFDVLASAGDR